MRKKLTLERNYRASLQDVWDLWTTKEGIESWWGPDGFRVTVQKLDLRPAGTLDYTMTAVAPEQVAFMQRAGMPLANSLRLTYREVTPLQRLAYENLTDFIPGVAPYEVSTLVELFAAGQGVRMVLTFDAMHDDVWTQRALAGHESELGRLGKLIEARS